jgi:hypothetical protein
MQIKVESMKRVTPKTDSQRDHWRRVNKSKKLTRKAQRQAKLFQQRAA